MPLYPDYRHTSIGVFVKKTFLEDEDLRQHVNHGAPLSKLARIEGSWTG
jgi:hypothetical protein